jgi:hypothetical protein
MTYAPALAAERPFLRLHREQHDAAVVAAVAKLDEQLRTPCEVEELPNWVTPGWTLVRIVDDNGPHGTMHLPSAALTPEVRGKLYDLMRAVESAVR